MAALSRLNPDSCVRSILQAIGDFLMRIRLSKLLVCFALGFASCVGFVMRPEEIEELMCNMNQPKIVVTIPEEDDKADPLKEFLRLNFKAH
jgi:hypothetical protein